MNSTEDIKMNKWEKCNTLHRCVYVWMNLFFSLRNFQHINTIICVTFRTWWRRRLRQVPSCRRTCYYGNMLMCTIFYSLCVDFLRRENAGWIWNSNEYCNNSCLENLENKLTIFRVHNTLLNSTTNYRERHIYDYLHRFLIVVRSMNFRKT